ncbi:MAG: hypothetical protein JRJ43_10190 [Deltaproteobacteria bacterium]|nr:hypothetical protein [Deltaproteobacteria bacterium]
MRNPVKIFETLFNSNDAFARQAQDYSHALKSLEWKFLMDAIYLIRGQMAEDMFSRKFTELTETEKDVIQKTYYNINQILDFLGNPQGWINRRTKTKQGLADQAKKLSKQMGGTTW